MITNTVQIRFPKEIDLRQYQRQLDKDLKNIADLTGKYAQRSTAFRDVTGELRKSITVEKRHEYTTSRGNVRLAVNLPRNREADAVVYLVRAKAPHAHLVEYGHAMVTRSGNTVGYVPAQPFLRPAFIKALQDRGFHALAGMAAL